jgi:hypothetical protein
MYRVGIDIPAGEYKLISDEEYSAYVCVYGSSSVSKDIVTNDNFENSKYITVKDGEYLYFSRCTGAIVK